MKLTIKVVPGSSSDRVIGFIGDALKVRVKAAAERGKANASVEKLVADTLGVARDSVTIVAGSASARKIIEIDEMSEQEVYRRLTRLESV